MTGKVMHINAVPSFLVAALGADTVKASEADRIIAIAPTEASACEGYLVTANHHEMDALDKARLVDFVWIR